MSFSDGMKIGSGISQMVGAAAVPEPATLGLPGTSALVGLVMRGRRKRSA